MGKWGDTRNERLPHHSLSVFDQRVIDIRAIGDEYIGRGASVLVVAVALDGDFFRGDEVRGSVLRSLVVGCPINGRVKAHGCNEHCGRG